MSRYQIDDAPDPYQQRITLIAQVAFLTTRLDERERLYEVPEFHEVDSARGPGWGNRGDCDICWANQYDGTESVTEEAYIEHLERAHQLTWALADIAAKRVVLGHAKTAAERTVRVDQTERAMIIAAFVEVLTTVVASMVQPYVSHRDFDPAWRVA